MIGTRTPLTPGLGIAFAVSFAGIFTVVLSRNARLKRAILPATLVVFSWMFYTIAERTGAFGFHPQLLVMLLFLNGVLVLRTIRYCDSCGRTTQVSFGKAGRVLCRQCAG